MKRILFLSFLTIFTGFFELHAQKNYQSSLLPFKFGNPLVPYVGMADPHIFIYDNKPYLYTTRDIDSLQTRKDFVMPDWHIWSTDDLIHWKHERTIYPSETYMGQSMDCWATDMGKRNGNYYFYFSNKNISTGVLVSKSPTGPFRDVLGKPLLDSTLTTSKEYDPTILIDDDSLQTPYILFGHHRDNDSILGYYIAKLNDDMVSLAEKPRKIYFQGNLPVLFNDDKPNLHKYNGVYYLSSGSHYATSSTIYGPYLKRGNSGFNKFGLTAQAHGNYFEWNNQWFHTWCKFHLGKEVAKYRESYLTYVHYKADGEMVDDTVLLSKHFAFGVGQYDANWDQIEAEWYMRSAGTKKVENESGFEVQACLSGGYLYFPMIANLSTKKKVHFKINTKEGGKIIIRSNSSTGKILGEIIVPPSQEAGYVIKSCALKSTAPDIQNLYVQFLGKRDVNLFSIDWFKFE